jgi:hypothetical protein
MCRGGPLWPQLIFETRWLIVATRRSAENGRLEGDEVAA